MEEVDVLTNLTLAPYLIKATALIGCRRRVGGNQFRHNFATLGILLDYKIFSNYLLLKASVIHDLIEDVPSTDINALRKIDRQANEVVDLVLEVSRPKDVPKEVYLQKILESGSRNAKLLKVADRISNLTDLHTDIFSDKKMRDYLDQTEKYILPMAKSVNPDMVIELADLIKKRRASLNMMTLLIHNLKRTEFVQKKLKPYFLKVRI
jgi:(p)ppGpp synthase/HD superfamily hydrolase